MAYFQGAVRSRVLQMDTNVNVIIPYDYYSAEGAPGKYGKVLYLLHGLKQNADAWPRMSSVERYANYYGYAVVMPEVQRSFYTDMALGLPYFEYITRELPEMMHALYRLPVGRENTYVGGLSMGGYGALKCALLRPDLYAGAMCFSSGFYMLSETEHMLQVYYSKGELQAVVGLDLNPAPEDDLDELIKNFPANAQKPRLYVAVGEQDPLHYNNVRLHNALEKNNFAHTYEEWAGGHDWIFWDEALSRATKLFSE